MSQNAPVDRPVDAVRKCQWDLMQQTIAPLVARARASYPEVKRRFLAGLPPRQTLFVTAVLTDSLGRREQVFVAVDTIAGDRIEGRIWSDIELVRGYHLGQRYELADRDLLDWMISKPDGSEEGNLVGKFLDTYQPPRSCSDTATSPR